MLTCKATSLGSPLPGQSPFQANADPEMAGVPAARLLEEFAADDAALRMHSLPLVLARPFQFRP